MAENSVTTRFIDALGKLERTNDVDDLASLFAEGAELVSPEVRGRSTTEAEQFWRSYRAQFDDVQSDFGQVDDNGGTAVLEWTSQGTLATGRPIQYAGVSLLTVEDGRVTRFATYYDTAAFVAPDAAGSASKQGAS
jgi:ketosteroid isomerase-like protein